MGDIKDMARAEMEHKNEEIKEENKASACKCDETKKCTLPDDSECIKDIDKMCKHLNEYLDATFQGLKNSTASDQIKILDACEKTIKLIDIYKSIRINMELARKIKFNIDPS